ncbi:MAG: ABA4-like family protein [Nostoc sp.]|uniref:ABA4-like family protein n=1 Tax=Nostoc sp. TaxID=1180 RepID=UPI002FF46C83
MTISQLFNVANLFVLPFWTLMILLPNWKVTRRIMESYLPFVLLAGAYLYLFINSITPENAQALSNPQLADIARFFANETAAATGWIHFLAMDLFVGRWIYWEGQKTGIWTIHSLALCFFAGPLGLLSHILTSWITKTFFPKSQHNEAVTVGEKAASSSGT